MCKGIDRWARRISPLVPPVKRASGILRSFTPERARAVRSAFLTGTGPATMSSREIAELTYKRHDHVMADIRVMLKALGGAPCFRGTYQTAQGKTAPCFNLSKRETIILVTGYSIPMRAAVVDRWAELEAQIAGDSPKAPQTLAQPFH